MGTDIHGFIECRPQWANGKHVWSAAVELDLLYLGRDYDAFGCLFGVRNHAGFAPLAPGRGLPDLISAAARMEFDDLGPDAHSAGWISWGELKRVDWDEHAETTDRRIHEYAWVNGAWALVGKAGWSARFARAAGLPADPATRYGSQDWPEGAEWLDGDRLYRVGRMTRREAVPTEGEWKPVWSVMEALAAVHGDENVRLTVWFDN